MATSPAAASASASASGPSPVFAECLVCAYPMDYSSRLPTFGVCNHHGVCSVCALRMRAVQHNHTCVQCKTTLDRVICAPSPASLAWEDYTMWGDDIGPDFLFDVKSQMFVPKVHSRQVLEPMWSCQCKVCHKVKRDPKGLRGHLTAEHPNLTMCLLCIEHRQLFPAEFRVYTQSEYERHVKHGDNDGGLGHPMCEFCRKRFYDKDALFLHLRKEHFTCDVCERVGISNRFYEHYRSLEEHFRADHFLCEDPHCLALKFVVFHDHLDLAAHNLQYHPANASRVVPMTFKVKRSDSSDQLSGSGQRDRDRSGGGGRGGGRGGGHRQLEGGVGGSVRNGEWQIHLPPRAEDPRESRRQAQRQSSEDALQTSSAAASSIQPGRLTAAESEEQYPSLPHNAAATVPAHTFITKTTNLRPAGSASASLSAITGIGSVASSGGSSGNNNRVLASHRNDAGRLKAADFPDLPSAPPASSSSLLMKSSSYTHHSSGSSNQSGAFSLKAVIEGSIVTPAPYSSGGVDDHYSSGNGNNNSNGDLLFGANVKVKVKKLGKWGTAVPAPSITPASAAAVVGGLPPNSLAIAQHMGMAPSLKVDFHMPMDGGSNGSKEKVSSDAGIASVVHPPPLPPPPPAPPPMMPSKAISVAKAPQSKAGNGSSALAAALKGLGLNSGVPAKKPKGLTVVKTMKK